MGRLRVWSGCEVSVSIAPVFYHSVLGGSVLALVWVGAISPYRVSPARLSSSSGACSAPSAVPVSLPQVIPMPVIDRVRLMRAPAPPR